ncbi:hypothetical protein PsorP6_000001 [Peronosclerospora sorghi]|uniref:Uncharacterized protein n=1 Tax=Peronosclerospora sorghi TaxID=230839 RepID=A0ACC0WS32_9STRA|nr:hypothetical protein PsorP6_000001 [Peronosclerospora sorghi]
MGRIHDVVLCIFARNCLYSTRNTIHNCFNVGGCQSRLKGWVRDIYCENECPFIVSELRRETNRLYEIGKGSKKAEFFGAACLPDLAAAFSPAFPPSFEFGGRFCCWVLTVFLRRRASTGSCTVCAVGIEASISMAVAGRTLLKAVMSGLFRLDLSSQDPIAFKCVFDYVHDRLRRTAASMVARVHP